MGYTCGLWQLFHVASVGVVEYNWHNNDAPIATGHASEKQWKNMRGEMNGDE